MKKLLLLSTLILGLGACTGQANKSEEDASTASVKRAVVATAGDIKPFSYEDKGSLTGYDIEVLKAADELIADYDFDFQRTSWESIFVGLDAEKYQLAANNLSYTEERAGKYLYSLPIAKNPLVLVAAPDANIKTLSDIAGKTTHDDVGTSTAKLVTDWNADHPDQPSTINYTGEDVSKRLLDLSNGVFDYLIFDKISVETIIKEQGYDLNVIDLETDQNPNNYIVFSTDSAALQSQFNQAIKTLYADGTLAELSQKYLGGSYLPRQAELE